MLFFSMDVQHEVYNTHVSRFHPTKAITPGIKPPQATVGLHPMDFQHHYPNPHVACAPSPRHGGIDYWPLLILAELGSPYKLNLRHNGYSILFIKAPLSHLRSSVNLKQ
ncbi:uncharacterized protein LOC118344657 [Juglans regia]|uniref:Uncharacterized protein LOC118344657 n=1 Tax=Juglans regia TaxID=51240 RepID=A0A6P9E2P6_JUGRE|nr:uncharacterized protein LOC118344657 [Juglans regia]